MPSILANPIQDEPDPIQDITAVIKGANAVLRAVHQIYPKLNAEQILDKLGALEEQPEAQELFGMMLDERKIKL